MHTLQQLLIQGQEAQAKETFDTITNQLLLTSQTDG